MIIIVIISLIIQKIVIFRVVPRVDSMTWAEDGKLHSHLEWPKVDFSIFSDMVKCVCTICMYVPITYLGTLK